MLEIVVVLVAHPRPVAIAHAQPEAVPSRVATQDLLPSLAVSQAQSSSARARPPPCDRAPCAKPRPAAITRLAPRRAPPRSCALRRAPPRCDRAPCAAPRPAAITRTPPSRAPPRSRALRRAAPLRDHARSAEPRPSAITRDPPSRAPPRSRALRRAAPRRDHAPCAAPRLAAIALIPQGPTAITHGENVQKIKRLVGLRKPEFQNHEFMVDEFFFLSAIVIKARTKSASRSCRRTEDGCSKGWRLALAADPDAGRGVGQSPPNIDGANLAPQSNDSRAKGRMLLAPT